VIPPSVRRDREEKGGIVRIPLVLALLGMTASCAWPPPETAAPGPVALAAPAPQAAAQAPTPPPAAAPQQVMAVYVPNPLAWLLTGFAQPAVPGRLTLSNFSYDSAHVEAVITPYPDCEARPGTAVSDFEIPLNGTRIVAALPGADVCWRRALPPSSPKTATTAGVPGWTGWNRVFTSSGRSIDSHL